MEFIPRSNGNSIRDFLFVNDVAALYANMAKALYKDSSKIKGEIFNAGTNDGKTVRYIIEQIYKKLHNKKGLEKIISLFEKNKVSVGEIDNQLMDYEKGKKLELDSLVVSVKEIGSLLKIKTPTIDKILNEVMKKISKK